MEKSKQILSKIDQVREILTRLPIARENDRALIVAFWRVEQPMLCNFSNAETLLRALANKELTEPEVITRARRKVQVQQPELRGHNKPQRYEAAEDVRQHINDE